MSDEADIIRLISEYCHAIDDGRIEDWLDLFTADGSFEMLGTTRTGREEIRAFASGVGTAGALRHFAANPEIDVDGDTATAMVDHILLRRDEDGTWGLMAVGRWHDELVRERDRWRFRSRRVEM